MRVVVLLASMSLGTKLDFDFSGRGDGEAVCAPVLCNKKNDQFLL